MLLRRILSVLCLLPFLITPLSAAKKPKYDALSKHPKKQFRELTNDEKKRVKHGTKLHVEERLGVPTFVWAAPEASKGPGRGRGNAESEARRHVERFSSLYDLRGEELPQLKVIGKHDLGEGAVLVTLRPEIDGIEIFREQLTVAMNQDLDLLAVSGSARGNEKARRTDTTFTMTPQEAVALALTDLRDETITPQDLQLSERTQGEYGYVDMTAATRSRNDQLLVDPARFKKVYFPLPDQVVPAWYVEVDSSTAYVDNGEGAVYSPESEMVAYVISAVNGEILFRNDLSVSDSFTYRVWADNSGSFVPHADPTGNAGYPHATGFPDGFHPPFIPPNLVNLQNGPISTNDPWLAPGSVETRGNNADAYADLVTPDGFTAGDFRADATSPSTFDRTYDTSIAPNSSVEQQKASVTQLFFMNNWLHDWFYDAGFNEASGNAQTDNFGRGGLGNDSIRAEAQDFGGTNNANMFTPSDGGRPRMQMFVFNGLRGLTTNSQPSNTLPALTRAVGVTTQSGPTSFNLTGDVARATPVDACVPATGVAGKIALVDRGGAAPGGAACGFALKVQNAQAGGAIGVIIANVASSNQPTQAPGMAGNCAPAPPSACFIPALSLNLATGDLFRNAVAAGNVNVTMDRQIDRDGTLDNMIIAHEWGHYISNRLVGNSSGLSNNQGGGMGEGFGDFHALLMTVREEDALVPANANWNGAYAMSGYATTGIAPLNSFYFGIRRYPYSTDMTKNGLTFRHISNGQALPAVPTNPNGNPNAQVHNTGTVWASMLWESYAALLRDTQGPNPRLTFAQAQDRMKKYLVAGYKLTPFAPTFVEARDAILAAAYANDVNDGFLICSAFAKRGAGTRAVAPDRLSTTNSPVTESYVCGNDVAFQDSAVSVVAQCDSDVFLDNSETATLTITLRNAGGGTLSNTTATVTTSNPHVSFPNGNQVSFAPIAPFKTGSASLTIGLFGAVGIQEITFDVSYNDPDLAFPGPFTTTIGIRANADNVLNSSATDNVESPAVAWTTGKDPALGGNLPSRIAASLFNHRWFVPNNGQPSDVFLISPTLNVAPTGSFSMSFDHRFSFEQPRFDGGVIEISTNGTTWTDVGTSLYNGTLVATGTNPLRGRPAFLNASAGYPAMVNVNLNLPATYLGQNVQIRFRAGADDNTASVGWEIDNISFQGITNTPFATLTAHSGACLPGRLLVTEVDSLGGHNPTLNEWIELRNVSSAPLDLIGLSICDDQGLAGGACDKISQHFVINAGGTAIFAADKNVFLGNHPGYPAASVVDDTSDSFIGVDGLDNNGDGVHVFDPSAGAVSIDCMTYHNSTTCFGPGVIKDDGSTTVQRSVTPSTPKLRDSWFRASETP